MLKVLIHYRQPGEAALVATTSVQGRAFAADVQKEAKGPHFEEIRDNIVHVLGTFVDDALSLPEYSELDSEFTDPCTAFIVMPLFSGGDLLKRLQKCKPEPPQPPEPLEEATILDYLVQILDAVNKLLRSGDAHRDLKCDNIFFTGSREGLALADFGEIGPLQLEFTKGSTSPGGAAGNLAPEVNETIAALDDGATATIDYSRNDVFAVGLIAYKMVMGDKVRKTPLFDQFYTTNRSFYHDRLETNLGKVEKRGVVCLQDAEPWTDGVERTSGTMTRLPEGRCSPGLKALIEDGLLNPVFAERKDAPAAHASAMDIQLNGGRASQINASVMQQVATPRTADRNVAQLVELMSAMGAVVTPSRAEAALRQTRGNVEEAWQVLESGGHVEEGEPPAAPPANADAVAALVRAFPSVLPAVANEALQASGGDTEMAADFLRARGHAAPAPPPEIDDAVKAELLQFGFAEEHIIEALVQAQGSKEGAIEILLARPPG